MYQFIIYFKSKFGKSLDNFLFEIYMYTCKIPSPYLVKDYHLTYVVIYFEIKIVLINYYSFS